MTDAVLWPPNMMPQEVMFHPDQPSRSGGRSITGREQVVTAGGAGAWRAKLGFVTKQNQRTANGLNEHMIWRAMLAKLEGRTNRFLIGPYDVANTPAILSGQSYFGLSTFSDTATFSDTSQFSQGGTPAEVVGETDRGAVTLIVDMLGGHVPQAGQYFGTYNRLYLIKQVDQVTGNSPETPNQYTLKFWPPLRAMVTDRYALNFDDPVCEMRFASDSTGELTIKHRNASSPSIDLVEVF